MHAKVDWTQAPQGARWWSMDANGHAHWHMPPNVITGTDFWFADEIPAPRFGFTGDWHKSLVERPPA